MTANLDVMLWGHKVGTLVGYRDRYAEKFCFYFDKGFKSHALDIAPLQASLDGPLAAGTLPVYPEEDKIYGGLPSFIADSLPDHWGNRVFAEWARLHNIKKHDLSSLDRLAYIGSRGMGALEFVPPTAKEMDTPFKVEIEELHRLAAEALRIANDFKGALHPDLAVESLFRVGTSAGGRRPKALINLNHETGECYSGQVPSPVPGFEPMIIKFDEHTDAPTTRIEYSYYLMAQEAGLNMMPSMLLSGERETHFLTRRFDRRDGHKVHIQTLAAMNPLADSYESLFGTAQRIGIPPGEISSLLRQMVMNVITGNIDDHNKNFSFLMDRDGVWHVAPAYDYTFTVDPSAPHYINRHSLTVNGKSDNITRADIIEAARSHDIRNIGTIIDCCVETAKEYRHFAREAGVGEKWTQVILDEIQTRITLL